MKKIMMVFVSLSIVTLLSGQKPFPTYYERVRFQSAGQAASGVGLYGYDNPAVLVYLRSFELAYWHDSDPDDDTGQWGLSAALPGLGFNLFKEHAGTSSITDYNAGLAWRLPGSGFGIGYEWHSGDTGVFDRQPLVKLGLVLRPARFVSLSALGCLATSGGGREGVIEIALRPLGTDRLTFYADGIRNNFDQPADPSWSAGVLLEPLAGLRLNGRYFEDKTYAVGLYWSLGRLGAHTQLHFNEHSEHYMSSIGVRLGGFDRTFLRDMLGRRSQYLGLDLKGEVKYRRSAFFDKSRTFLDLLTLVERARRDPKVAGMTLNLSGMAVNPEMAWELRSALVDFKASGKRVVIYADNLGMTEYHLASVADRIVLDPCGIVMLPGVMWGRYYIRHTLDKMGIGVEEWRFFKYKSAAETVARDAMSEADREQWQAIIDDWYELVKNDVCSSRGITPADFDSLIDHRVAFMPDEAVAAGLADTVGRAEAVEQAVTRLEGRKKAIAGPSMLVDRSLPWDYAWGDRPVIAVVYALGECAMDQGIKARQLAKDLEAVSRDRRIKAVVFRVDSPGGDGLASDVVAEALKQCAKTKPVIVTQGLVAGSGGYWISMYGDTILAAPHTLSGSIGVIGFWFYNQGLNDKVGVTTDKVQRGEHADLGYGFSYPLMGMLPDRNLTDDERLEMERLIRSFYREFVAKVAAGRNLKPDSVDAIGQGRVWSGTDGRDVGLIDELGGLQDAIAIARARAGIPVDAEMDIVELPKPPMLPSDLFKPKLVGVDESARQILARFQFLCRLNGRALAVMPLDYLF